MSRYSVLFAVRAMLWAAVTLTVACDRPAPSAPAPQTPPLAPAAPVVPSTVRVWAVSPNTGTTRGGTPILISGQGFEPGATVTIDGHAAEVTVVSGVRIAATTAAHGAGTVDVVVRNTDSGSGTLNGGYTYAVVVEGPPPSIAAISPDTGTIGGGGSITITGAGFQPGAIVRLDDVQVRTFSFRASSTRLDAGVSAHAAGRVDVVVINPDGQSATLKAGYRYAAPGTLDYSGDWKGGADDRRDDHGSTEVALKIENNKVVSISCNEAVVTLSPAPLISNDEFAFSAPDGRVVVTGRFLAANQATGTIDVTPCGLTYRAMKQ